MARYNEGAKVIANLIKDKNRLKAQIAKPSDKLTYLKRDLPFVRVVDHSIRVQQQAPGHALIVGHPTNGKIGNGYNGVDGQQIVIGSGALGDLTHFAVINPNNKFYEDFSFNTYTDVSETTATVDLTNHKVVF